MEKDDHNLQAIRLAQMRDIQSRGFELFRKKNQDYGDAFAQFGIIGVLVRIQDKIQRAVSISKSGVTLVSDERLEDTLLDLHNYAAMALMLGDAGVGQPSASLATMSLP